MNNDPTIQAIGDALKQAITTALVPLQTTKEVRLDAFDEMYKQCDALAVALKGREYIPKTLLNEIYSAAQIILAEAPYAKGRTTELEQIGRKMQQCFDLILIDESPADRVPSVPRIC